MSRETQLAIWEEEHREYRMFPFLASECPGRGVVEFLDWISSRLTTQGTPLGLEICCGNGRNARWLARRGIRMCGFDFSEEAIRLANSRQASGVESGSASFVQYDANERWPYQDRTFDFIIDCFGSSEMESAAARSHVLDEALRVLKPGGYYSLQIDSPEIGFFAERIRSAAGPEPNTLRFPNGKIESVMTENDVVKWNHPLKLVEVQLRLESKLQICGSDAPYKYYWIVAQAPAAMSPTT